MKFKKVMKIVKAERDYQDFTYGGLDHELKTPGEFIAAMQTYLNDALAYWQYANGNYADVMSAIRKVTALGVQAMEKNGASKRKEGIDL